MVMGGHLLEKMNEDCATECHISNRSCSSEGLIDNNILVDSERELLCIIDDNGSSTDAQYCLSSDIFTTTPSFSPTECTYSLVNRLIESFDCNAKQVIKPPTTRICFCHDPTEYINPLAITPIV